MFGNVSNMGCKAFAVAWPNAIENCRLVALLETKTRSDVKTGRLTQTASMEQVEGGSFALGSQVRLNYVNAEVLVYRFRHASTTHPVMGDASVGARRQRRNCIDESV